MLSGINMILTDDDRLFSRRADGIVKKLRQADQRVVH